MNNLQKLELNLLTWFVNAENYLEGNFHLVFIMSAS